MEIKDLAGEKVLSGIDRFNEDRPGWEGSSTTESVEVVRICLDGVVYEFSEDPSDGYRSSANGPTVIDAAINNVFAGVPVVCQYLDKLSDGFCGDEADILRVINAATGQTILDVGTGNIDDYYPSWICNFDAAAIGVNV